MRVCGSFQSMAAFMENKSQIQEFLRETTDGKLAPDEFFCMVLSLSGGSETQKFFLHLISDINLLNPSLHNQLSIIYETYFAQFQIEEDLSFGNGIYDEDAALAEALKTSLSYATPLKNSQYPKQSSYAGALAKSAVKDPVHANHSAIKPSQVPQPEHRPRAQIPGLGDRVTSQKSSITSYPPGPAPVENAEKVTKKKRNRGKKSGPGAIERPLLKKPAIYWIRRDLRIYDNEALLWCARNEKPIIPVFLWSEKEEGPLAAGGAVKLWFHHALKALNESLQKQYSCQILYFKTNSCHSQILNLVKEIEADTILWNELYEPYLKTVGNTLTTTLQQRNVEVHKFHSYLLHEPESINTEALSMWGIGSVSHFMESCRQSSTDSVGLPEDPPGVLPTSSRLPSSHSLDELGLARMPRRKDGSIINWAASIVESWDFSEDGGYQALQLFLENGVKRYEKESGRSDQLNTCRISPYLHFGQLTPRTVLAEARQRRLKSKKFMRKLAWRDLSYWLLYIFPHITSEPCRPQYKHQRWSTNKAHLKAWQRGYTGYPLVDASMRQLWATGWMNNYMRHVVASFLISYLHISWVEGYNWFQDTLVDADCAINAMMWQNGGMSGLDQWNFVMHPVNAAMTCDPKGDFVRKWIPELARLHDEFIHQPWKCPAPLLRRAGVSLGVTYPERIITDLESAREQSLRDVVEVRRNQGRDLICQLTGNDLIKVPIPGPRALYVPVITRKEFKYRTHNPGAKDNPHSAVLAGYRSRKRDELIAFENKVDFTASTMSECMQRMERCEKMATNSTL